MLFLQTEMYVIIHWLQGIFLDNIVQNRDFLFNPAVMENDMRVFPTVSGTWVHSCAH